MGKWRREILAGIILIFLMGIVSSTNSFAYNYIEQPANVSYITSVTNNNNYYNITMGVNSTQMENITVINIKESWLSTFIHLVVDSIFTLISQNVSSINTTANIQNLLNATGIYSTYNLTYDAGVKSIVPIWINDSFQTKLNLSYPQFVNILGVMYVNGSSGRIGIGTAGPNQKVEINGSIRLLDQNAILFKRTQDNYGWRIRNTDPEGINTLIFDVVSDTSQALGSQSVYSASANTLVLKESGKVGIGTATPNNKLYVEGTAFGLARFDRTTADATGGIVLTGRTAGGVVAGGAILGGDVGNTGDGLFFLGNDEASSVDMVIDSNGKVGIGTSSPTHTLNIVGTMNVTTNVTIGSLINLGITTSLPTCGTDYNGSIMRNTTGVYGCATDSVWVKIF